MRRVRSDGTDAAGIKMESSYFKINFSVSRSFPSIRGHEQKSKEPGASETSGFAFFNLSFEPGDLFNKPRSLTTKYTKETRKDTKKTVNSFFVSFVITERHAIVAELEY
jgi:hypothetical protein